MMYSDHEVRDLLVSARSCARAAGDNYLGMKFPLHVTVETATVSAVDDLADGIRRLEEAVRILVDERARKRQEDRMRRIRNYLSERALR